MMKFENSMTMGNVLTAVTMLLGGAAVYANMNERIAKVETAQVALREAGLRRDLDIREVKIDIRDVLAEIKADIKDLRQDVRLREREKGNPK